MINITIPVPIFNDIDGFPLEAGFIYIGMVNQNPETNPIPVYFDSALTQPAAQPLRTAGGMIVNAGNVMNLYTATAYSITVRNKNGSLIYTFPDSAKFSELSFLTGPDGSSNVGFIQAGTGAITRTVQTKLREFVSVKDFGAIGDGSTDDTTTIQAAINATQGIIGRLFFPPGTYIASGLTVSNSLILFGSGTASIVKQKAASGSNLFSITGTGNRVMFENMTFDGNQAAQAAQSLNSTIHSTAKGGALSNAFNLVVQNCEFRDSAYSAVRVQGDNDPTTKEIAWIINNLFRNGAAGVDNPGATNDYIPRDIALDDAVEVWVENNFFDSDTVPATFGRSAVVIAQTQTTTERLTEATIVGNRINRRGCNVSQMLGAIDLYIWAAHCVIRGNIIKNSTATAVKWKQNASMLHIVNNKVDSQLVAGAAFDGNDPTFGAANDLCIVEGNQVNSFAGGTTGVIIVSSFWSATSDFSTGIVIRDNQLNSCSGTQIQVLNSKAATIDGNQMYPASGTIGILMNSNNDGETRVTNNYIGPVSGFSITISGANAATIDPAVNNNTCIGCTGTYSVFVKGRRVQFNGNYIGNCVNGVTFNTITDLEASGNILKGLSGTVGFLIDGVTNSALFSNSTVGITNGVFYNQAVTLKRDHSNTWNWVTAAPGGGFWNVGDILYNSTPVAGGSVGFICTTTGNPGLWKTWGNIAP